jgi:molybdate transport system ATP-binding protein
MSLLLKLEDLTLKSQGILFQGVHWEINSGEHWIITGKSGSGKTSFLKMLQGNCIVESGTVFNHFGETPEFGLPELLKHTSFVFFLNEGINYHNYYYQQRYYSTEVEGTVTARDFLLQGIQSEIINLDDEITGSLHIRDLLSKELIKLSNGETRRLFIAKALLRKPKLLILDNPYIGLDSEARQTLNHLLCQIAANGVHLILSDNGQDYPDCMTHVLEMENLKIKSVGKRPLNHASVLPLQENPSEKCIGLFQFQEPLKTDFAIAASFSNLIIKYGDNVIINGIDWTIRKGEKWALTGLNGAGKSMLLGVVFADHPQAYANKIIIFDQPRGSGETIWDIKEQIGYVSPELHFYFERQVSSEEAVMSVLYEHPYKRQTAEPWHYLMFQRLLDYFQISHLRNASFHSLSTGQQRLILLLRVIVKNPPLLLLDEPFQGFDMETIEKSKFLLDQFCKNRTLIMVSHHASEIPSVVNHLARLKNGKLIIS